VSACAVTETILPVTTSMTAVRTVLGDRIKIPAARCSRHRHIQARLGAAPRQPLH